jgi:hypothetical protein
VSIAAYAQMSFHDEIELSGHIGTEMFAASSHVSMRGVKVAGTIGHQTVYLNVRNRRLRAAMVTGEVLGQPISGGLTTTNATLIFEGMAGQEPLRYVLSALGPCTNQGADLGVRIIYQAIYSELVGSVDRVPDGVMLGLLLPVAGVRWEAAYH